MTRAEVLKSTQQKLKKIKLEKLQKIIGEKFYGMDQVVEALYIAISTNTNIILYGPGGFGKSEITLEFLKQTKLPYSALVGYEDMDVEALMGLPNIKKMMEESIYELSFDRSIFRNPGVLVLEEFLDVNPRTATALKDVLTVGGLRQGTEIIESLASPIVICSNKSPEELSFDDSSSAFYLERFPLVVKVFPHDLSVEYYKHIISIMTKIPVESLNKEYEILAELAFRTTKSKHVVSPRTIRYAIKVLKATDFDINSLELFGEIDTNTIEDVKLLVRSKTEHLYISTIEVNVQDKLNELLKDSKSQRSIMDSLRVVNSIQNKLNDLIVSEDESLERIAKLKNNCSVTHDTLWSRLDAGDDVKIGELFTW